jgi:hypothetical protein
VSPVKVLHVGSRTRPPRNRPSHHLQLAPAVLLVMTKTTMMAESGSEAGTEVETAWTVDPKDSGYLDGAERPTMAGVGRQAMAEWLATAQRCC